MTTTGVAEQDTWSRLPVGPREHRQDALLALALAVGIAVSTLLSWATAAYDQVAPWWVSALMVVANAGPLAFRRRFPMTVAVVVALAFAATQLLHVPEAVFINFTLFIGLYTVGAWCADRVRAEVVRWTVIAGMFTWLFLAIVFRWSVPSALPNEGDSIVPPFVASSLLTIVINLVYFGAAWYSGNRAWASAVAGHALRERTSELAVERERTAAQAIALERVRIARELHDVVAHHVSLMGVQAGAARRVLDRDPAQAATSLSVVEDSARTAVQELRRMLGTLRETDGAVAPDPTAGAGDVGRTTAPSTDSIDRIAGLADAATTAGHPARFTVVGAPRTVPPTVATVAFRVAQEAVTNVLKHAGPGAAADLRLRWLPDAIEVEVTDTGIGSRASRQSTEDAPVATPGCGLGHVGMRERVAAVGGTVEIGPRARGGFLVRAWLPTT